jgi:hypothetical protein
MLDVRGGALTMRTFAPSLTAAVVFGLVACSAQSGRSPAPQNQATQAPLTNPTDFPLMNDATVLDVKPFKQTVKGGTTSGLTVAGAGTYSGTEVLAGSTAPIADVHTWLVSIEQKPPAGYEYQPKTQVARVGEALHRYGIEYAVFKRTDSTNTRGVIVVVMDPARLQGKLGFALGLVDKYRMLPASLRTPIDKQLKDRTGFSGTEATDPSAPLGMTLTALNEIHNSNERAIVLVDASRQ